MYFVSLEKSDCSGCTACLNICPKHCISMSVDREGFKYPIIDSSLCINCGLCKKVCPWDNPDYSNSDNPDIFAAYLTDIDQRSRSTSGGVFYSIASWVIQQKGVVFGAAFDGNNKLRHIGVDNLADLDLLRGSKYLQSDLGNIFGEVKSILESNRWVYFVGVGCQVAGLKAFLHKDYDTLITSDLVCHGVPSQQMFDWHLDYLRQKEKGRIISYSFRDCAGWGVTETYKYVSQTRGERVRRLYSYSLSPYLYSFMYAYNYRYSCYDCKFARIPRQGDVTLADYWGAKKIFPELDVSKGVSLVLVNTSRGKCVWNQIKASVYFVESCVKDAAKENANLIRQTPMPEIRRRCYEMILQRGYKSVAENEFRAPHYWGVKCRIILRNCILGKILRTFKNRIVKR